jgi:hypothetical protein
MKVETLPEVEGLILEALEDAREWERREGPLRINREPMRVAA